MPSKAPQLKPVKVLPNLSRSFRAAEVKAAQHRARQEGRKLVKLELAREVR